MPEVGVQAKVKSRISHVSVAASSLCIIFALGSILVHCVKLNFSQL